MTHYYTMGEELIYPWRVDQRHEVGFDGEGSEYETTVPEIFPAQGHPTQVSSLDMYEAVEYLNAMELRLRRVLEQWKQFTTVPEQVRTPVDWVEMAKVMMEAEDFLELNAYAYAHQRILERSSKDGAISKV